MGLRIAFVAALSEKKLAQKLGPLQALDEVEQIDVFRCLPISGPKLRWRGGTRFGSYLGVLGRELYRVLALMLSAHRYDVLVGCHQSFHGLWAAVAGRLWRKPVIQLLICQAEWVLVRPHFRAALLAADAIGVRGDRAAETLRRAGFTGELQAIANPMDLPPLEDQAVSPVRDLLLVGDYAKPKDYPWMLEVAREVHARRPELTIGVVGRGRFEQRLGPTIRRYGLTGVVKFLGPLFGTDLDRAYRESRVLCLTSSSEGLPMVVVEAMALARPVVVTAVGELEELIRDHREGRIVPHGATELMAEALLEVLDDPDAQDRMGAAGRRRIEELMPRHSIPAIAEHWQKLLAAVSADSNSEG